MQKIQKKQNTQYSTAFLHNAEKEMQTQYRFAYFSNWKIMPLYHKIDVIQLMHKISNTITTVE